MEVEFFLVSFIPVILFGWYFQIKWKYLLLGLPPFLVALFMELFFKPYFSAIVFLIFIVPVIEEVLKFLHTAGNKDKKTGVAIGLMFAGLENFLYFMSFSSVFFLIFILRELSDPILHSTTTSISTRTWKGKILTGIGLSIFLHSFWNFFSVIIATDYYLIWILASVYFTIEIVYMKDVKLKFRKKVNAIES